MTTGSSVQGWAARGLLWASWSDDTKEPIQVRVSGCLEDLPDASKARTGFIHVPERDGSGAKSHAGAERAAALLKAQRESVSGRDTGPHPCPPGPTAPIPPPNHAQYVTPVTPPPISHCSSEIHIRNYCSSG